MLFLFATAIGASLFLQRKIRQEYDGVPDWKTRRQLAAQVEAQFRKENEELDLELSSLLAQHRALVARRDGLVTPIRIDLYDEAMEELEYDLARDPLEEAFKELEKRDGEEKKKKKGA